MEHSGFENRFIDTYLSPSVDSLHYAQIFKPNDTTSITVFPGKKAVPFSSAKEKGGELLSASIILPVAILLAGFLFIFLKNILKSSVGSLFLVGISPKLLQENERRQIERNTLIVNSINAVSFFAMALFLYAFFVRFEFLFNVFVLPDIPDRLRYLTIFLSIFGVVFLFFYARSGLIALFGEVFSAPKEMKNYQKPYKLLFVSMSPVLLLVALFTAFAPFSFMSYISFYLPIFLLTCYVVFIVVSLLKFLNFTNRFSIHIFLYLCTLEILPLLVMVKWMQDVCF